VRALNGHWWKILGLAGFVGVTATGAVIIRAERRRRSYTPEEIRERLHARLAETAPDNHPAPSAPGPDARRSRHRPW
jgi:hypothetical protein